VDADKKEEKTHSTDKTRSGRSGDRSDETLKPTTPSEANIASPPPAHEQHPHSDVVSVESGRFNIGVENQYDLIIIGSG
jgi:hypothetical protein